MKEFSLGFDHKGLLKIFFENQKVDEHIYFRGLGFLCDEQFEVDKSATPIITFEFNRSLSSWNDRTAIKLKIEDSLLDPYTAEIRDNILLGIEEYENKFNTNQAIRQL
jgi:hypothetical protein